MPADIRFECKFCNAPIYVPQDQAGTKVKCPKCKNPVMAPMKEGTLAKSDSSSPQEAAVGSSPVRGSFGLFSMRTIVKLIILIALLIAIYMAYQWWTSGGKEKVDELKDKIEKKR